MAGLFEVVRISANVLNHVDHCFVRSMRVFTFTHEVVVLGIIDKLKELGTGFF